MEKWDNFLKNDLLFSYKDGIYFLKTEATPDVLDKYKKYIDDFITREGCSKLYNHIDKFVYCPKVICEILAEAPMLYDIVPLKLKENNEFINMCLYHNPHIFKYMETNHNDINIVKTAILLDVSNIKYVSKSIMDKIIKWLSEI